MRLLPIALAVSLLVAAIPSLAQSHGPAFAPHKAKVAYHDAFRVAPGSLPAASLRLGALEPGVIAQVKQANATAYRKRLDVGIGREVGERPEAQSQALQWRPVGGGRIAHWRVTSEEARALRVSLDVDRMPPGMEMRFAGVDRPDVVYGPFGLQEYLAAGERFWSPVLEGDTALIELYVPAGAATDGLAIRVAHLSHLFVSPADPRAEQLAKASGPCHIDIICRASDTQLMQTSRAVARMTITDVNGRSGVCTGTLLNPADNSFTPYLFSAAHCISTPGAAAGLSTHWFYERATCGTGSVSSSAVQLTGGSQLLYANVATDAMMVRLNASPPTGAIFAGWDASAPVAGVPVTAIHHPDGDPKKVSTGTLASLGPANDFEQYEPFARIAWTSTATGVTEPGSSGGGFFTGNSSAGYRFRGGLLGGPSSCTASASQLYDEYSRLDTTYPYIAQYLFPGNEPTPTANVVANAGFESAGSGWTQSPSNIVTSDASVARTGSYFAWLGGANNVNDSLSQDITVPQGHARLQFWYRVSTAETASGVFDTMTVALLDRSSGAVLQTLAQYSNRTPTASWQQSQVFDLSKYAGQTVRLRFSAQTDASDVTHFRVDDLSVTGTLAATSNNYTALWWNAAESGWGINVNQQGDTMFATLFTYDSSGAPLWLVMSGGTRQAGTDSFTGELYRTTGPVFNANPFTPITGANVTRVGTMTLAFTGPSVGTLTYSFNGATVTKAITRQVYGTRAATCTGTTRSRSGEGNFQDLWWNPNESGWGINVTHQGNTLFATLFTYGSNNQATWFVMSAGVRSSGTTYTGDLYRTSGPAFNAQPWGSVSVTRVGTMTLAFSGGETGTLTYSVDGAAVTKSIQRQVFAPMPPACF